MLDLNPTRAATTPTGEPTGGLMDHLATIDDPRAPRGRRYSLPTLLALAVYALTSAGHDTTCAIIEWAHNAPRRVLLALGLPACPFTHRIHIPDEHTLRNLLAHLDPAQLTRAGLARLNTHTPHQENSPRTPARAPEREHRRAHHQHRHQPPHQAPRHTAYATDGKTQRGARARKGQHSTSVVFHATRHHDAALVASTQIPSKGVETGAFITLLDQLDDDHLQRVVITADALHTVAAHATYLRERGAHYLIYVKGSHEVVFAVTDLDAHQVSPAELAAHARGHWTVENRVHYVRDVTFREDARRTRTGVAPVVLGVLTDIARQALTATGWKNLASGRRAHTDPDKVLELHGITPDQPV